MSDDYQAQWDRSFTAALRDNAANAVAPEALVREVSYWQRHATLSDLPVALDAGCGVGPMVRWLAQRGFAVDGLDVSGVALGQCEAQNARWLTDEERGRVRLVLGSVAHIPLPDNAYDLVVEANVIQHLTRSDRAQAFAEIYRVLKPGGLLVAQQQGIRSTMYGYGTPVVGDPDTYRLEGKGTGYSLADFPTHFFSPRDYWTLHGFPRFSVIDVHHLEYGVPQAEAERRGYKTYVNHFMLINCIK